MTSMRYWAVSLQVGCFGILIWSKMHLAFLSISWYHLILHHFLKLLLIFWQTSNIFQVERRFWSFWLILVFSTMGRGLECFFRMRYHIFPRVTILVTTHVTIFLWEFCTISNAVALLVHYQMCYCVCLIVHFQWNKYIYHFQLQFVTWYYYGVFLKNKYINIFLNKLMVMHGNLLENWQLYK